MTILHVDPPCETCGSEEFELVRLDNWEDRAEIKCLGCGVIIDTPIGYRMMVVSNG